MLFRIRGSDRLANPYTIAQPHYRPVKTGAGRGYPPGVRAETLVPSLVATTNYALAMPDSTSTVGESATPAEQLKHLLDAAVPELNALAWLNAFNNSADRGRWDPGWSCRDHAVTLAALLTARGAAAQVIHGSSVYVQGPTSRGEDPVGLGNVLEQGGGHTWAYVPALGTIDASPRLGDRVQTWRPLPATGLVGAEWQVTGLTTQVVFVDSAQSYQQAVDASTQAVDTATAIYWPKEVEPFQAGMLDVGYIDSPLAHRLTDVAGPDCYIKLTAHLLGVYQRVRRPLVRVSQRKAWRFLNEVNQELIDELTQAIGAQPAIP